MKKSNSVLFVISCVVGLMALTMSALVLPTKSTSVISITDSPHIVGGGLTFKLPEDLTSRQIKILGLAYDIAKKDGHKHPQLLQGIVLKESNAGEMKSYKVAGQEFGLKTNERYYGVAQIKLAAAKDVLQRNPQMINEFKFHTKTDEEIIAKLIENDVFNISVASKYLLILKALGNTTINQIALAYNQGPEGAKNFNPETHPYPRGVLSYISKLTTKQND